MSVRAVEWAKAQKVANGNQRSLLVAMAGMSDDEGNVILNGPLDVLIAVVGGIDTPTKMARASSALLDAGLVNRQWSFDDYLYHWKLGVK